MLNEFRITKVAASIVATLVLLFLTAGVGAQQDSYTAPRTPDGAPDLNGIWQALGSAHWDLEGHAARQGGAPVLGGLGAISPGLSVVEGGKIPYQDWALEKRAENRANWLQLDPGVKCYMPGIPRATYMPHPFQILQSDRSVFFAYEWDSTTRVARLDRPGTEAPLPSWMGYSLGRFEGETLVIDVTSQVPETWFDASGNFHSDELRVTERYTRTSPDALHYEVTIEDPKVFTRPWKISMPLYRRLEENAQILEYKCVEFAEEAMFGEWYRHEDSEESDSNE